MAQTVYKRRFRNYLLDSKVQLRFTLMMVAVSTLLTAGLGYFWYSEIRVASRLSQAQALATLGVDGAKQLDDELKSKDHKRLALIVGFAVLFAALIAIYGIMVTHKVVGPLHKIKRHMKDVEEGRLYQLWGLRKGDQLQEFFDAFQAMHSALRDRCQAEMKLLSQLIAAAEKCDGLDEEMVLLRSLRASKGDSLRDASDTTQKIDRATVEQQLADK